jgi:hypothetical protein
MLGVVTVVIRPGSIIRGSLSDCLKATKPAEDETMNSPVVIAWWDFLSTGQSFLEKRMQSEKSGILLV